MWSFVTSIGVTTNPWLQPPPPWWRRFSRLPLRFPLTHKLKSDLSWNSRGLFLAILWKNNFKVCSPTHLLSLTFSLVLSVSVLSLRAFVNSLLCRPYGSKAVACEWNAVSFSKADVMMRASLHGVPFPGSPKDRFWGYLLWIAQPHDVSHFADQRFLRASFVLFCANCAKGWHKKHKRRKRKGLAKSFHLWRISLNFLSPIFQRHVWTIFFLLFFTQFLLGDLLKILVLCCRYFSEGMYFWRL